MNGGIDRSYAICIVSVLRRKDVKLQQNKTAISLKNNRPYFSYWWTKVIFLEIKKSELSFLYLQTNHEIIDWMMRNESRKHRQIFHYWRFYRNRSVFYHIKMFYRICLNDWHPNYYFLNGEEEKIRPSDPILQKSNRGQPNDFFLALRLSIKVH